MYINLARYYCICSQPRGRCNRDVCGSGVNVWRHQNECLLWLHSPHTRPFMLPIRMYVMSSSMCMMCGVHAGRRDTATMVCGNGSYGLLSHLFQVYKSGRGIYAVCTSATTSFELCMLLTMLRYLMHAAGQEDTSRNIPMPHVWMYQLLYLYTFFWW